MKELGGRVAVVTGAASGIGYAMVRRFAEEGMRVVLADVEAAALERATQALTADGYQAIGVVCDVSDWGSVKALADKALESFGAVHIVCNNAGVASAPGGYMWNEDLHDWSWHWSVNVMGVVHGIQAFVPILLRQNDEGHVVNTSSGNGGISPFRGLPVYAATKAAVTQITECLYGQLEPVSDKIGVSVLYPGPKWLNTNLWTAERNRPAELAPSKSRQTFTFEGLKKQLTEAGQPFEETPLAEVADFVVRGIRERRFWLLPEAEHIDAAIRARAEAMLARRDPTYLLEERLAVAGGLGEDEESQQ